MECINNIDGRSKKITSVSLRNPETEDDGQHRIEYAARKVFSKF